MRMAVEMDNLLHPSRKGTTSNSVQSLKRMLRTRHPVLRGGSADHGKRIQLNCGKSGRGTLAEVSERWRRTANAWPICTRDQHARGRGIPHMVNVLDFASSDAEHMCSILRCGCTRQTCALPSVAVRNKRTRCHRLCEMHFGPAALLYVERQTPVLAPCNLHAQRSVER